METLSKYGNWATALASGETAPYSDKQRHFVAVCSGEVEAETDFEFLWLRYEEYLRLERTISGLIEERLCLEERSSELETRVKTLNSELITTSTDAKKEIAFLCSHIEKLSRSLNKSNHVEEVVEKEETESIYERMVRENPYDWKT